MRKTKDGYYAVCMSLTQKTIDSDLISFEWMMTTFLTLKAQKKFSGVELIKAIRFHFQKPNGTSQQSIPTLKSSKDIVEDFLKHTDGFGL